MKATARHPQLTITSRDHEDRHYFGYDEIAEAILFNVVAAIRLTNDCFACGYIPIRVEVLKKHYDVDPISEHAIQLFNLDSRRIGDKLEAVPLLLDWSQVATIRQGEPTEDPKPPLAKFPHLREELVSMDRDKTLRKVGEELEAKGIEPGIDSQEIRDQQVAKTEDRLKTIDNLRRDSLARSTENPIGNLEPYDCDSVGGD